MPDSDLDRGGGARPLRPSLAALTAPPPALALIVEAINAVVDRVNGLQGELAELRRDLTLVRAALLARQKERTDGTD